METKICKKCGRTLPLAEFRVNQHNEDGRSDTCKECKKSMGGGKMRKVYSNPDLASFSPRQLIDELKARGYTGELRITQKIVV